MKSSSRLESISGERSWDSVCNGNQRVKAMSKGIVNRNVVEVEPVSEMLQNIILPRVSTVG